MNNPLKRDFQILRFLFVMLLVGQFVFLLAALFFIHDEQPIPWTDFLQKPMLAMAPGSVLLAIVLAQVVQFFQNKKKRRLNSLPAKMHHYRDTVILKAAFFEMSSLYCIALSAVLQNLTPLVFFAISTMLFLWLWPTVGRLKAGYGLE